PRHARASTPRGGAPMNRRVRALGSGLTGGLLAGAVVGCAEAIAVWGHAHGTGELPALGWALVAYGIVGGALGLGAGAVAAVLGGDGFGLARAGVGASLAFVVARFRIVRDVFLEQMPRGPLPLVVQLGALLALAAVAVALWRWLRGADARGRPLTRPLPAAALVAALALVWTAGVRLRPPPA